MVVVGGCVSSGAFAVLVQNGVIVVERGSRVSGSLLGRVQARLRTGATVDSIARAEGVSVSLVQIMVEELTKAGKIVSADSLCSSGLGACGDGSNQMVSLYCAGCPLAVRQVNKA